MVKALSFKGDKKPKKRKREGVDDAADNPPSKSLTTTDQPQEDEEGSEDLTWVNAELATDLAGPTLLVLPTSPPSALATDAFGKVFASQLVNIDPSGHPATAEPHDVRQVWIANRVAGSDRLSLKGHHGRYLGCDKFGVLTATREAISVEESWALVPAPEVKAAFVLQTTREGFVGVEQDEGSSKGLDAATKIRGDMEDMKYSTTLRVRMQGRFKPKLKVAKEEKAREKISRKELEEAVGRRLDDDEVRVLKKARREGDYYEALLDIKVKGKHDKFA